MSGPPNKSTRLRVASERPRIVLLAGAGGYRSDAFVRAAAKLNVELVLAADIPDALKGYWKVPLRLDYGDPDSAAGAIASFAVANQVEAIVAADDSSTLIAALASKQAGLPCNDPDAALAARDKRHMRERLASAGLRVPAYRSFPANTDPVRIADSDWYPVVVKPTRLSGSRGVIRADNPFEFIAAFARTRSIVRSNGMQLETSQILVEEYLPGDEVAVEALLSDGKLDVLAIFDKPDPLEGPFFEETIYVTPSRKSEAVQKSIHQETAKAAASLGLHTGPVHAELRINERGVWIIELAGRSIGGLCSTVLEFGSGISLEELIIANAVEIDLDRERSTCGAGVMMIPIPRSGLLRSVEGIDEAAAVAGITGIEITAPVNARITALPEGESYLGFIFARADDPATVEAALRLAHARLTIRIDDVISLAPA